MDVNVVVHLAPKGKARPRVTRHGHAFMPADYVKWKKDFAMHLIASRSDYILPITGDIYVRTIFHTKTGNCRSDCDNAHAACLDALQDAGWIENDRQVKSGYYKIVKDKNEKIEIGIEQIHCRVTHATSVHHE